MVEKEWEPEKTPEDHMIDKAREMDAERVRATEAIQDPNASHSDILNNLYTKERIKTDLQWMTRLYKSGIPAETIVSLVGNIEDDRKLNALEADFEDQPFESTSGQKRKRRIFHIFKRD